jgi:hypothetical protein
LVKNNQLGSSPERVLLRALSHNSDSQQIRQSMVGPYQDRRQRPHAPVGANGRALYFSTAKDTLRIPRGATATAVAIALSGAILSFATCADSIVPAAAPTDCVNGESADGSACACYDRRCGRCPQGRITPCIECEKGYALAVRTQLASTAATLHRRSPQPLRLVVPR